jgi:hypothetical protein
MRPKCRGHCDRQGVSGLAENEKVLTDSGAVRASVEGCCFEPACLLSLTSRHSYSLNILIQR